jgi:hypothetical protein
MPPSGVTRLIAAQDHVKPARSTALIQRFKNGPAIVAAVTVGSDSDLAFGNASAPIVVAVKYIDDAMLREIDNRLQLPGLHAIDDGAPALDTGATQLPTPKAARLRALPGSRSNPAA